MGKYLQQITIQTHWSIQQGKKKKRIKEEILPLLCPPIHIGPVRHEVLCDLREPLIRRDRQNRPITALARINVHVAVFYQGLDAGKGAEAFVKRVPPTWVRVGGRDPGAEEMLQEGEIVISAG